MKFFIVYKTTHVPSGKFYIGHITDKLNDGYYGSGKIIKRSQKYSGSGNPRAKRWVISFEDGRPSLEVVSLKTWCKDNNVKYTSY